MCVLGGEGKEDVKETSLCDHPGATLAVSLEVGPRPLHSYTPHIHTVTPGSLTSSTPGFPQQVSDIQILKII